MRILFLTLRLNSVTGGGSHKNAIAYMRALQAAGHDVAVHAMYSTNNQPPAGIAFTAEDSEGLSFLALLRACREAMRHLEKDTDIFFVYGHTLVFAAGMYRAAGSRPVVAYLDNYLDAMPEAHRNLSLMHRLKHLLWGKLYGVLKVRHLDRWIAVSPYIRDRYIRFGFPAKNGVIVPNAFAFSPPVAPVPAPAGGPAHFLSVGRFSHEKGNDVLIDALARLPEDLAWDARIVGGGPDKPLLHERIRALGLEKNVSLVSWMDEASLRNEYARADILINPARWPEPFGRTIVEAMHAGTAVIVPQDGAGPWVAGEAAQTFVNGDPQSLAHAIIAMGDERIRGDRVKKGRARAEAFDVARVGPELVQLLEKIAAT